MLVGCWYSCCWMHSEWKKIVLGTQFIEQLSIVYHKYLVIKIFSIVLNRLSLEKGASYKWLSRRENWKDPILDMVHKTLHISSMLHDDMDTLFFGCVCSAHSKGVWDINFYEKNKPKNHYFSVCACSFKNKSFEFFLI